MKILDNISPLAVASSVSGCIFFIIWMMYATWSNSIILPQQLTTSIWIPAKHKVLNREDFTHYPRGFVQPTTLDEIKTLAQEGRRVIVILYLSNRRIYLKRQPADYWVQDHSGAWLRAEGDRYTTPSFLGPDYNHITWNVTSSTNHTTLYYTAKEVSSKVAEYTALTVSITLFGISIIALVASWLLKKRTKKSLPTLT